MLSGGQYQDQMQIVFDTGMVKLADFGLSKTLPINKHAEYGYLDSKFRLTGETGGWALGGTKRGSGKETLGAVQSLAGSIYPNNASVHCLAKS
jgi:hypothetical protein